jgi:hypothetical protein
MTPSSGRRTFSASWRGNIATLSGSCYVKHPPEATGGSMLARTAAAVAFTVLMIGCSSTPSSPSAATPSPTLTPAPAPPPRTAGIANRVLSGAVVEITPSGRIPVEGVAIYLETCSLDNCPDIKAYEVKTDRRGEYRISGVFDGQLNFLWATDAVYKMADPMPLGTCPDNCDRLVTVSGDTRLDIELMRR